MLQRLVEAPAGCPLFISVNVAHHQIIHCHKLLAPRGGNLYKYMNFPIYGDVYKSQIAFSISLQDSTAIELGSIHYLWLGGGAGKN